MKVGVITIQRINNYGAELQAFALQRKLNLLGFDCENIDYLFYKHRDYRSCRSARPIAPLGWKNRTKEFLYPKIQHVCSLFHFADDSARCHRFDEFHRQHTRMSPKTYFSMDELYAESLEYDAYIVGSDQVWNPRANTSLKPYFLTFTPPNKRKLSYASSFGVDCLPATVATQYAAYLQQFDFLSVREKSGVDLVRSLTGREPTHVVDPTLLLDQSEWDDVASIPFEQEPYILLYDLLPSSRAVSLARELASRIKRVRIVRLCRSSGVRSLAGIDHARDAGPSEFVGLFQHAQAVVTNSFHGTLFSVLFQKPFYSIIPTRMKNPGRIHSFLDKLGLVHRILPDNSLPSRLDLHVDYSQPYQRLARHRHESLRYLSQALETS